MTTETNGGRVTAHPAGRAIGARGDDFDRMMERLRQAHDYFVKHYRERIEEARYYAGVPALMLEAEDAAEMRDAVLWAIEELKREH